MVAESVLVKQQLLILNRSRKRSPNLRLADRLVVGVCALLIRPGRLIRSAIVLKPSTLLSLHRALTKRKYRRLFSPQVRKKPGRQGPTQEVMAAVVDMKQRNPTWGCPRIAQQMALAWDSHQQGRGAAHSRRWVPTGPRLGRAILPLAFRKLATQSIILSLQPVLGVRVGLPLRPRHASHRTPIGSICTAP